MGNRSSGAVVEDDSSEENAGSRDEINATNPFEDEESERAEETTAEETTTSTTPLLVSFDEETTTSASRDKNRGSSTTRRENSDQEEEDRHDLETPLLASRQSDEEEEEQQSRCGRAWACLCCLLAASWASIKCFSKPFLLALRARRTKCTLPLVCLSIVAFTTMMYLSGYRKTWTINGGESRQVLSSWLTKSIHVQVHTLHSSVEIDVYSIPGKCPPLTGPRASVHHKLDMNFNAGEFQFDNFFLNKGSRVEADLKQLQGTSEVYMLQGQDKLHTLQSPPSTDDWLDQLLQTAKLSWRVKQYDPQTTAKFRSITNDVYTLVYDNPYQAKGHLQADLWLDLTTYNLQGYTPVCHDLALQECPSISKTTMGRQCILVDASASYGASEEVQLNIVEHRNYALLLLLSLAPTFFAILYEFWNCARAKLQSCRRNPPEDNNTYEPPSLEVERPPPTSPSAPPASEDAAYIPVATAEVVQDEDKEKETSKEGEVETEPKVPKTPPGKQKAGRVVSV